MKITAEDIHKWADVPETTPVELPVDNIDTYDLGKQKKVRYEQNTRFRKHLSRWVMCIVPSWIGIILVMLFFQGFGLISINDKVLITLLATTTANILGLAYIVLKGVFPEANNK